MNNQSLETQESSGLLGDEGRRVSREKLVLSNTLEVKGKDSELAIRYQWLWRVQRAD